MSKYILKIEKMLELFTKSEIRKRLILLFFYNRGKEYYLSEIARQIKTSPGTTQRELNRLLKIDFISMRKIGGLNVYKLNEHFQFLEEFESIVSKTIGIEIELKDLLKKIRNIDFAFIFGSYAKKGLKFDSDIDFFIIGNPDEDMVYNAVNTIENKIRREINYHISDRQEFRENLESNYFYRDIIKNHILIKGNRDDFKRFISETD